MGYPLGTPVASLMDYILALQKEHTFSGMEGFFTWDVLFILNHRYINTSSPDLVGELIRTITENNKVYIRVGRA